MLKMITRALFKNGNRFKVVIAVGIVTLAVGFFLQWYPTYVISGLTASLKQSNLQIEDIWRIQGSLVWWNTSFTTIFQPVSLLLFAAGMILVGYYIIWVWMRIRFLLKH